MKQAKFAKRQAILESPPVRGCGLKLSPTSCEYRKRTSPPVRGCGLKPAIRLSIVEPRCHPPCGGVD